jgi:hypothetical protein
MMIGRSTTSALANSGSSERKYALPNLAEPHKKASESTMLKQWCLMIYHSHGPPTPTLVSMAPIAHADSRHTYVLNKIPFPKLLCAILMVITHACHPCTS